jgi:hypothetical protein
MQNALAKASFTDVADRAATPIHVHFNPVSLQYRVSNTLRPNPSATAPSGNTEQTKQYLTGSSATLTLELSFDSTDSGRDVRDTTSRIAEFMRPKKDNTAAVVLFSWGSFQFQGMFRSYQETLDFFSPEGVPLRAAVSISMDEQNRVINERASGSASGGVGAVLAVGGNLSLLAGQIGDPRAARGIALANGSVSLRLDAGASLEIGAQVSISAAAGFATGASVGFGAGAGIGVGAGVGFGASAGVGLGVSAGASAGSSLGGAASLAPFGELRTPRAASFSLNPQALLPAPESTGLATDAGAGFSLTGAATPGTASLSAKLG